MTKAPSRHPVSEFSYVLVYQGYALACPAHVQNFMQAQRFQCSLECDEGTEWLTCSMASFREIESTLKCIEQSHEDTEPTDLWVGICCGANWVEFCGVFESSRANDAYASAVNAFACRGLEPLWVLRLSDAQQTFCERHLTVPQEIAH